MKRQKYSKIRNDALTSATRDSSENSMFGMPIYLLMLIAINTREAVLATGSANAGQVYMSMLSRYADTGQTRFTHASLADRTGLSLRTVVRCVTVLEESGMIVCSHRADGNTYSFPRAIWNEDVMSRMDDFDREQYESTKKDGDPEFVSRYPTAFVPEEIRFPRPIHIPTIEPV